MLAQITNAEYHARPEVSSSQLKELIRSPAHYWAKYRDPNRKAQEPSKAMQEGTVLHSLVLEPDTVRDVCVILPDDAPSKRSKAGEQWWADFEREARGRIIIAADRYSELAACANNVRADEVVQRILADTVVEGSGFWKDRETGVACRFRPDAIKRDASIIVDLKSTSDASAEEFSKSIANFGYHVSAAMYLDGALEVLDAQPHSFLFLAVETFAPFAFAVYRADATVTSKGEFDYRRALKRFAECEAAGDWPAYPAGIWPVSLPKWARKFDPD